MDIWFVDGGPDGQAYHADFDLSRALVSDLHSLDSWLPESGWQLLS